MFYAKYRLSIFLHLDFAVMQTKIGSYLFLHMKIALKSITFAMFIVRLKLCFSLEFIKTKTVNALNFEKM